MNIHGNKVDHGVPPPLSFVKWDMKKMTSNGQVNSMFPAGPLRPSG